MQVVSRRTMLNSAAFFLGSASLGVAANTNALPLKSALQQRAQTIVDTVLAQLKKEGRPAKGRPLAVVRSEPFIIGIELKDLKKIELVLPAWEEVGGLQGLIGQLVKLAGANVSPRMFFEDTFNWALIAHEVGHYFFEEQVAKEKRLNFYGEERQANQFMVAFWNTQPEAKTQLDRCGEVWDSLFRRMPSPVPQGVNAEEYFNKNYVKLSEDPMAYGWYQFQWMAEAWRAREKLVFSDVLNAAVSGKLALP